MKILKAIKDGSVRVSCGFKWLVFSGDTGEYVIYEREYGKKITKELLKTADESEAMDKLIRG